MIVMAGLVSNQGQRSLSDPVDDSIGKRGADRAEQTPRRRLDRALGPPALTHAATTGVASNRVNRACRRGRAMTQTPSAVPWREWASEAPSPPRWPTDVGARIRTLVDHAKLTKPLTLRVGPVRVPVLDTARIYVCGITPYDTTHLGHAATFVWADLAARVFRLTGVDVQVCRNVTDVDDHLLAEARTKDIGWRALASEQTYRFEHDMDRLGVVHPAYEPRSFDHVDEVISLTTELVTTDAAYVRDGNVYFRGRAVHEAAGIPRDEAITLLRLRGGSPDDPNQDDPLDAVLWQRSEADDPAWPSPWGQGRPGWHAECTAMALSTFGPSVDLHVSGADLAFPHNAYEAAQAEAYTGVAPFARSWMHVGMVMVDGRKMAKSAGNLVFVHDLIDRFGPGPLRLLLLDRNWREPWDFEEDALDRAAGALEDLLIACTVPERTGNAGTEIVTALVEDLDVPRALQVAREVGGDALRDLMGLLGLT
jgi:cysteinyl-tRNA synthetase